MKTKESLIVAVITISMFSIIYVSVPANPKAFKMPIPKSEHRKVQDRLEQTTKQEKKDTKTKLSVINIEECNCNRWHDIIISRTSEDFLGTPAVTLSPTPPSLPTPAPHTRTGGARVRRWWPSPITSMTPRWAGRGSGLERSRSHTSTRASWSTSSGFRSIIQVVPW